MSNFFLKAIGILSIVIVAGIFFLPESNENIRYKDVPVKAASKIEGERIWNEVIWEENDDFSLISNDSLYNPVLLTSSKDRLYVGDWADMSIKALSGDGSYLHAMGSHGRGPGEFQRIMDIGFFQNLILISDPEKHEVIIYSDSGEYSHSYKIEYASNRIAVSENGFYTLAIQDSLFGIYDFEGDSVSKFGRILDDPIINQLSLSGRIAFIDQLDMFLYIPRFASYLYYYNHIGQIEKVIETLDGLPFSGTDQKLYGNRVRIQAPQKDIEIMDYVIEEDKLYLLGRLMNGGSPLENDHFIDVYDISGDKYFHSFKIPVPAHQFSKIEETFYFIDLTDQSLVSFRKKSLK